jgi:aspartyl-tRNA(Asn)/glutamyl-tRNA(Gln) amidotransferase subunit A
MTGTYALSSGYYDAYYRKAQKARTLFITKYRAVLEKYNALLMPVTSTSAMRFGELLDDPVKNMMMDIYTGLINVIGVPSLALPCGFTKSGLPIGMQLVGRMFSEDTLLRIGHAYQTSTDWHTKVPPLV